MKHTDRYHSIRALFLTTTRLAALMRKMEMVMPPGLSLAGIGRTYPDLALT
jgi:hypothetical protein